MVRHLGLGAALQLKGGEGTVFLQPGESWECGGGPWARVTDVEGAGGNTANSFCPWLPSLSESSLATSKEARGKPSAGAHLAEHTTGQGGYI